MPNADPTFPRNEDNELIVISYEFLMGFSLWGEESSLNNLGERLIELSDEIGVDAVILLARLGDKMRAMGGEDPNFHYLGILLESYSFDENRKIVKVL